MRNGYKKCKECGEVMLKKKSFSVTRMSKDGKRPIYRSLCKTCRSAREVKRSSPLNMKMTAEQFHYYHRSMAKLDKEFYTKKFSLIKEDLEEMKKRMATFTPTSLKRTFYLKSAESRSNREIHDT